MKSEDQTDKISTIYTFLDILQYSQKKYTDIIVHTERIKEIERARIKKEEKETENKRREREN